MPSGLLLFFVFVVGMLCTDLLVLGGSKRPRGEVQSREVTLDGNLLLGYHDAVFVPDGEKDSIFVVTPGYPPELVEGLPVDTFEAPAVTEAMKVLLEKKASRVRVRIRGILVEKKEFRRGFGFGTKRDYSRMILLLELKRLEQPR